MGYFDKYEHMSFLKIFSWTEIYMRRDVDFFLVAIQNLHKNRRRYVVQKIFAIFELQMYFKYLISIIQSKGG